MGLGHGRSRGVPNVIFKVSSSRKIFRNCTMAEDFPSFSTSKNAVPQIRRENSAILEKLQDSANSQSTLYSTQKNKSLLPKNLTIFWGANNVIFKVSSSRKIFRNCTMAEDFQSFSTSKNAVPQIRRKNLAAGFLQFLKSLQILSQHFILPKKTKFCSQKILPFFWGGLTRDLFEFF